jgi:hypothetical protein
MAQPTVNRFYKGLNSDVSLTDRGQEMFLDGHNIRLTRREEGTLWAANFRGNEETFALKEGYVPVGAKEFDGFLFIFSVNPSNSTCEIGSFPSPDPVTREITRDYRPLHNYTPSIYIPEITEECLVPVIEDLGDFNTHHLGLQCNKPLRIEIRLDFDGSVNLYWTDDNLPWRTVNCGFILASGLSNNRFVTAGMILSGYINGINENSNHPIVDFNSYSNDGRLKVGNYFFFVRYTDINYSSTSFLGQSGPVPLFLSSNSGALNVTEGGTEDALSGKSVTLEVSNLDTNIQFYEVGYIRYFGENLYECFLIDKKYSISGLSVRSVKITGNEPLVPLTIDELIVYKPSDALYCKDIAQYLNQFFIANTRGPQLDHPDLRRFMCALTISESYQNNGPADEIRTDTNNNPYSTDGNDTEENVGYFSGETYCFSVIPVLKGGFVGLPYPMTGYDNYLGLMSDQNNQGIFRFRRYFNAPAYDGTDTFIKGINVNTLGAAAVYGTSAWLQENLIGVYVARAERNKNLLYQGLSLRCYNGKMNPKPHKLKLDFNDWKTSGTAGLLPVGMSWAAGTEEDWNSDSIIPLFEPATYMFQSQWKTSVGFAAIYKWFHYARPYKMDERNDFVDPTSLAVFSLDYYIDRKNIPDNTYVELLATTTYDTHWRRESTSLSSYAINNRSAIGNWKQSAVDPGPALPDWINFEPLYIPASVPDRGVIQTFVGYNQNGLNIVAPEGFRSDSIDIPGWNGVPNRKFVSRFNEGKIASQQGMYYYEIGMPVTNGNKDIEISMPVATPDYIGITNAPFYEAPYGAQFNHFYDRYNRSIVNVYMSDPATITYTDLYDFKNSAFNPIGKYQPISDFLSAPQHTYYRGDCIVARTYLKIMHGSSENLSQYFYDVLSNVEGKISIAILDETNAEDAAEDLLNGYGHWVSIVTENVYNPSYRHELGRNKFYPKTNPLEPGRDFAWEYDSPESYFFNYGFKEYLGPRQSVGIDLLQPLSDNRFPTRIRPSIKHIFGAVRDGYRQFIPADAKDFDYSAGQIQAIAVLFDTLYSFQNRAINIHPLNERITQQGTAGSTAILGESSGLTEYKMTIKQGYGTQHRFGVVLANQALYCIDFNKRAIMRIAGQQVQMLDIEKGVQTWFRNIIALGSSGYSDVLESLPNEHTCGRGIHGIYNKKYKDVVWTLKLGEETRTIVFNEEMDCFVGTHGYKPNLYAQVEEDMYSFIDNRGWLHDVNGKYLNFYGNQDIWKIKVSVSEGAEITKHYDNIIITSNNRVFSAIKFETQHQTAEQRPFLPVTEFWYAPTYRENEWRLPVRRADNVKEPELNIYDDFGFDKTPMRGRYMLIELEYDGDKELWVREIMTFYNLSFA